MLIMNKREYNTIHQWLLRHYVKTGICETCKKEIKTEWSNKTGNYDRYNRLEWQELCHQCHHLYDVTVLGKPDRKEMGAMNKGVQKKRPAGFASMSKERLREISIRGGRISKRGKSILA